MVMLMYLHYLRSIQSVSYALPNNLSGQHNVFQHCLMHRSKCAAAGPLNSRSFLWRS